MFYDKYHRAIRHNTTRTIFDINLAVKSVPHQLHNDKSFQL